MFQEAEEGEGVRGEKAMKKLLLFVFAFLSGCSFFVTKPDVAIKSVTVTGLDSNGAEVAFLLAVTNPNSYDLKLTGYEYTLLVSDFPLAKGEVREVVEFAGKTTTDVRLPVRVEFRDLREILKRSPDPGHLPYRLTAAFALQAPFVNVTIPVEKNGSFALPLKGGTSRLLQLFH